MFWSNFYYKHWTGFVSSERQHDSNILFKHLWLKKKSYVKCNQIWHQLKYTKNQISYIGGWDAIFIEVKNTKKAELFDIEHGHIALEFFARKVINWSATKRCQVEDSFYNKSWNFISSWFKGSITLSFSLTIHTSQQSCNLLLALAGFLGYGCRLNFYLWQKKLFLSKHIEVRICFSS